MHRIQILLRYIITNNKSTSLCKCIAKREKKKNKKAYQKKKDRIEGGKELLEFTNAYSLWPFA